MLHFNRKKVTKHNAILTFKFSNVSIFCGSPFPSTNQELTSLQFPYFI